MFQKIVVTISLFCLILLAGCKIEAPKQADEFGQKYLGMLLQKEYIKTYDMLSDQKKKQFNETEYRDLVDKIVTELGQYNSIKMVGWNVFHDGKITTYNFTYELQYPNKWLLFAIEFLELDNNQLVSGWQFTPIEDSLENINKLTFKGKGTNHYFFVLATIIEVLFILYVLALCVLTRIKKKVLWFIFIMCGVVSISLNWSTGTVNIQPISIQFILGISFFKSSPFAPWILTFSIPFGAIFFLIKRKKIAFKK